MDGIEIMNPNGMRGFGYRGCLFCLSAQGGLCTVVCWFDVVLTALVASAKLSYVKPVSTGIGDHLWRVYHPGIYPGHSAWPLLHLQVQ